MVDGKVGTTLPSSGLDRDPWSRADDLSASKRVNAMELLVVDSEVRPEAVLVHATGEIDSSTAGELRSQLEAALQQAESQESRLLIIDLQGVTYFGSAGLNAVLDCHKQGLRAGTSVRLVADNGSGGSSDRGDEPGQPARALPHAARRTGRP